MIAAGIEAIATYLPSGLRTNAFWPVTGPATAPGPAPNSRRIFDEEMWPYLSDPFFGAVQRRVMAGPETSVSMGLAAAQRVLEAARIGPDDVCCLITVSMFADKIGAGDAGFLARQLNHRGGAFSVEATCAGSLRALLVACGLVGTGQCTRVLVVVTGALARAVDIDDPDSRVCGDAAAAFLVAPREPGTGVLGSCSIHTGKTCGTWLLDAVAAGPGDDGGQKVRLRTDPSVAHVLRRSAEPSLRKAVTTALERSGVTLEDIGFFVFNAASAWHAKASARVLGVDPKMTLDTFPMYGNIGPALQPVITHIGAVERNLAPEDLVLLYGYGGQAEAIAVVMRWGYVALGPLPEPAVHINPES